MKQLLLAIAFFTSSQLTIGQTTIDYSNTRDGEDVEYCKTHKKMKELLQNPEYFKIHAAREARNKRLKEENGNTNKQFNVVTLPVVFHVLHDGGSENISREQILDAVDILNRDFRLQNNDANNVVSAFQGMPADAEIEFKLATLAPNGACFSGITRTQTGLTNDGSSGNAQMNAVVNGNDVYQGDWPGDKYLNIFVVNEADGAAGYTMNPFGATSTWMGNGIWILHNYVGSIGTSSGFRSRALTHEVGHWLDLSHTWGGTNNPGVACGDDNVPDTPETMGWTSCNLTGTTCNGQLDNVENYMEYSYCSKMFTPGQVSRMRNAIDFDRDTHWDPQNIIDVGAIANPPFCAADFYSSTNTICQGSSIDFTDNSFNGTVNGWDWSFPGGTPSTSTSQNPTVTYNTPGTYSVTLTATDGSASFSKTKNAFITVMPSTGNYLPIYEGFEAISNITNSDWTVVNPNNDVTWAVTTAAAATDTRSVAINNNSNTQVGEIDELISSAYDLSNMASVTMTFRYAFARKNSSNTDQLQIWASDDCGVSWFVRKSIAPSQMSTNGNVNITSGFVPTSDDWKDITVSTIVSNYLADQFRYKFVFTSGGGNRIYLDDINIYGTDTSGNQVGSPTVISELINSNDISVYPNPTEDNVNISIDLLNNQEDLSIGIYDLLGKRVLSVYEGNATAGNHIYNVSTNKLNTGMYLVLIENGNNSVSKKLMIK